MMNSSVLTSLQSFLGVDALALGLAVALGGLLFKLKPVLELHDYLKTKRLRFLKDALGITSLATSHREIVEDEVNKIIFKEATGIKADTALRDRLIDVKIRSGHRVTFDQLRMAREYLVLKGGYLQVSIENWQYAYALYSAAAFLYFGAIEGWLLYVIFDSQSVNLILTASAFGGVVFIGVRHFFLDVLRFMTAKRLKPIVHDLELERLTRV